MGEKVQVPDWITVDFLQKCLLSEECRKTTVITKFVVHSALPPGKNFNSNVFRVHVECEEKENDDGLSRFSIIVKAPLKLCGNELSSQTSEANFYNKFLPLAVKISDIYFAPKHFQSALTSVIVMEDLKAQGFLLLGKTKKLDFEHCKLYMIGAAKFHAVSHAVCKESPDIIPSICRDNIFSNDTQLATAREAASFYGIKCMASYISKMEVYEEHAKLLDDYLVIFWKDLVEIHKPREDFNSINQGDPWIANMMFKYDSNGRVTDIKLLDFQQLLYTSPIHDIVFFLAACPSDEMKKNSLEELYNIYFRIKFQLKKDELQLSFDI